MDHHTIKAANILLLHLISSDKYLLSITLETFKMVASLQAKPTEDVA